MKNNKFLLGCTALAVCGCTPTIMDRGNMLSDMQMKEITVGTSTKSDVLHTLGSPTTQAPFDENDWFYVGQKLEKKGILDPKIIKERIVEVKFAADGTLADMHELPPGSDINVPYSRDKTPTYGNEVTVVQQFFGNLGRFNKNQDKTDNGGGARKTPGSDFP